MIQREDRSLDIKIVLEPQKEGCRRFCDKKLKAATIIAGIFFLLSCAGASSDVSLTALHVRAIIGGKTEVSAVYEFSNDGGTGKSVKIGFAGLPENSKISLGGKDIANGAIVSFAPGEKKNITLVYWSESGGVFYYDKNLQVDGYYPGYIGRVTVLCELPADYTVISSNGNVHFGNGTVIQWEKTNVNPVILAEDYKVIYTGQPMGIEVTKELEEISLSPGQTTNVNIYLYNNGTDAQNLVLEDVVQQDAVGIVSSADGTITGDYFSSKITWNISLIEKGETQVYSYTVAAVGETGEYSLAQAKVSSRDTRVQALSNYVEVYLTNGAISPVCIINGACVGSEDPVNCPEDCAQVDDPADSGKDSVTPATESGSGNYPVLILTAALVLLIMGFFAFRLMRK